VDQLAQVLAAHHNRLEASIQATRCEGAPPRPGLPQHRHNILHSSTSVDQERKASANAQESAMFPGLKSQHLRIAP